MENINSSKLRKSWRSRLGSPINSPIRPLAKFNAFLFWPSASSSFGLALWNFRRGNGHSTTRQRDLAITRPLFLRSFSSLHSFLQKFGKQAVEHYGRDLFECKKEEKYLVIEYVNEAKNEESKRPKSKSLEMKPFFSSSITDLCYSGSFGVISQNRQSTWRFALWCSFSPSCTSLQHRRALGHWATWYCFAELLTMHRLLPFSADLIIFFKAQHTRTKGDVRPFYDSPSGLGNPQAFISLFFSAFRSFLQRSIQALLKTSST
ncbi:hypothetical protein MTR67_002342 [Solanum verrucosum]|uniref:Uncharacterized protein n=1 Tax=Solanum verrucosum TaxID=315347 RepID=A0AAF0PQT5_SOLVR|nr:hypothetical protein MTR67_002342 [Solanum verrucosum]